jgi:membrane protease YdiL (CAAX protease family)
MSETTSAGRAQKRGLLVFLLLSFGLFWGWLVVARLVFGWSLVNPLVQLPGGFTPAIAALVVRRWVTREGFGDDGSRPRLRASWRFYLLALLGPLGIAAAVVGVAAVTGWATPSLGSMSEAVAGVPVWTVPLLLCLLALASTVVFWGEEYGWTGYLLLRIFPGRPRVAALAAGLIAAVWHYPLAFLGYAEYDNVVLGIALWTVWILCQEVLLAWLRERSGSIWPACLAHAGNNMILVPLTSAMLLGAGGLNDDGVQRLVVLVLVVVAAGPFLRIGRPQREMSMSAFTISTTTRQR